MKYKRLGRFSFLLLMLVGGVLAGQAGVVTKWVKTDAAQLATNDVVVIVDATTSKAMSNDKGKSEAPTATAVTLNDDKSAISSDVPANLQWTVTVGGDNPKTYKFSIGKTDSLYCTNTNNGVRVGINTNNAFTVYDNNGVAFLVNSATSRYLGVNSSTDWRCYTSINNNIKATVTTFYKKTEVEDNRTAIEVAFPQDSYKAVFGQAFSAPTASVNPAGYDGAVTYNSTNEQVATVNTSTGAVTLVGVGTTTINAVASETNSYQGGSASYTLTCMGVIEDGVFDFALFNDYGSGFEFTKVGIHVGTWTAGNVKMYAEGRNGWYSSDNTLKLYGEVPADADKGIEAQPAGKLTFSVEQGYLISGIEFTGTVANMSASVGNYATGSGEWKGAANSVSFTATGSVSFNVIKVTYRSESQKETTVTLTGDYPTMGVVGDNLALPTAVVKAEGETINAIVNWTSSDESIAAVENGQLALKAVGTATLTATFVGDANNATSNATYQVKVGTASYTAIAAMIQAATTEETSVVYNFNEVLVTYVKGSNTYISDGTNGFLLYGSNLGLEAGDKITGSLVGSLYTYKNLPEIKVSKDDMVFTKTSTGNAVEPATITADKLAENVNKYIKIENATYVSADGNTLTFKVGETSFTAYNQWNVATTDLTADKNYTITAMGSVRDDVYQIYPISFEEETAEQPAGWRDIKADFTNGSFFTAEEQNVTTAGLKMNDDGTFTRVAADDATANAVISGKYHSDQHGLANFSATVKVQGTVKVSMGSCNWGGDVIVKNAAGQTVATFNTSNGACWSNSKPEENVLFAYYKVNEPTTLTISGGSYTPYFAVEAVSPDQIPNDVKFVFDVANSGAEGIGPETETVAIGENYTLPKNFTLYKEGNTLTGWTDGTNTYAPGETIVAPEAESITLTPVFTENTVSLTDRTEAVTVKWNFRRDQGAPAVGWEGKTGLVWVAQAEVNGQTIDVALPFSTSPGKFNNKNNTDWVQVNNGTTFTVPSCKGATVSMEAYSDITTTAIDGQTDYTSGKTISYTIAGAAETVNVVIGDGSYYRYIQVVLPVVQSQGGGDKFENVAGTITWTIGNETSGTTSEDINGAISSSSVSTGDGLKVETAKYFETEMVKYTPSTSNAGNVEGVMIQYRVKPAKGITFKPTQIDYAAVKVGTDNATYSWSYTVDGKESTITEIEPTANLLRNNGNNSSTAKLMHTETFDVDPCEEFTFRFYISKTANNKNICIGNVTISGIVNGESVSVNMYTLATAVAPEAAGSINVYPKADEYEEGSEVTLTATENFGFDFVNWTNAAGQEVSTEAKFKYTVNSNETLTANFKAVETYELKLTVDGTNDYMVTVSPEPTVVDGKNMYEAGTAVSLTANQYEGLVTFTNWSDGETASSKIVSMTENIELTALYAQADIIAGWDFYKSGSNGRKADFYAQDNDADALNLVNTESGETSGWLDKSTLGGGGYESFKGAAVNWRTGSSNGDVGNWHWQTKVNAEAFTDINVQFQMLYNYNAYQTYDAEYSLDGENWTKFGSITMTGSKAEAAFSSKLPSAANNQKDLYIRMKADKTSSKDGAASANDGNTLAMFFITGTPKLVDDGTAPKLVSTVPATGATGASAAGKIVLTFDERVKVAEGTKATLGTAELTPTVSGKTVTFEYKGLEYSTEYTFTLPANSISDLTDNKLAEAITISFTTMTRPAVTKATYDAVVSTVEELTAAIAAAQARTDKNTRFRIFIKNGKYTLPRGNEKTYRHTNGKSGSEEVVYWEGSLTDPITYINTNNVSFIGESRDGVIITNDEPDTDEYTFTGNYDKASKFEGIGNSDVFQLRGEGYYWQDLTVETGMEDGRGRDIAIQDRGTKNVYKNVGLRGYQDTWTSNNDNGLYYFEGGYVRGRTDYMCGKGDIFWNGVELLQIAGGYAAVPSKPAKYGWIYKDCVINGEGSGVDGNYTLGRPWGSGTPIALFIDTKMNVVPSAIGWNEMSGGWPARFAEYNSMTNTGSVIDLSGRKKTFGDGHANNPVLTAEEALENSDLHRMYGEWDPTLLTEQAPTPKNVTLTGTTLTWDASDYALCWAVVKNDKVVDFTTEPTYTIDDASAKWAVRAANEMGGLGEAATAGITDGINEVSQESVTDDAIYNIKGMRVKNATRGIYIVGGRKVVVK